MTDEISLLDSNILVYAFDASEKEKHEKAKSLLEHCFLGHRKYAVSLQNLSEFFVISTRKIANPITKKEAADIVEGIIAFDGFLKLEPTKKTVIRALSISISSTLSYWDALIAAAMLDNGIFNIYTENIKDFSKVDGIKIKNPFVGIKD